MTTIGLATGLLAPASTSLDLRVVAALAAGIVGGVVLLVRGFGGYRQAERVGGIAPSRIASVAAGEVLVTGTAEAIELTLVSALQSAPCLYYRSRITDGGERGGTVFREERAVGFRVRDATGGIRVFPAGARFDVPDRYDEHSGPLSSSVIGLQPRRGSIFGPGPDREAQIAALLTVQRPAATHSALDGMVSSGGATGPTTSGAVFALAGTQRRYSEARIEPGDIVTVVGSVVPFSDLADPAEANLLEAGAVSADDPEINADLAAARAAGTLAQSATAAWGNAAIEGFGIGRPVRRPSLDPLANPLPTGDATVAARARDAFEIAPDTPVLAAVPDGPLLVSAGAPAAVVERQQDRFLLGLLGAALAIGCAIGLAILLAMPRP